MNILITGGSGFIGSNLALALLQKNYQVTVLDSLSPQIHGNNPIETSPLYQSIYNKVNFINGDVCNKADITKAIQKQQIIVHLAAETGTGQSMYQIEKYSAVNMQATAMMLDVLANTQHHVQKLVVASSRAIYGEGKYYSEKLGNVYPSQRSEQDLSNGKFNPKHNDVDDLKLVATDENSIIHPSSVYGITKQVQEQLVMTVCPSINIHPVALRYQNVYGAGQSLTNPYTGILSIFSNRILNNQDINIFEDGEESRDFVYISDVVNATILAIEKPEANGEVFNVGTGIPTTVNQVVKVLMSAYNKNVPAYISGNYRIGDIRHNYACLQKISIKLGFKPAVNFEQGIQLFASWVKQQKITESQYEKSLQELKEKGLLK